MGSFLTLGDANLLISLHMAHSNIAVPRDVTASLERISRAGEYDLAVAERQWQQTFHSSARLTSNDSVKNRLTTLGASLRQMPLIGWSAVASQDGEYEVVAAVKEFPQLRDLCVFGIQRWGVGIDPVENPCPPIALAGAELDAWPAVVVSSREGHCAIIPASGFPAFAKELLLIQQSNTDSPEETLQRYNSLLDLRSVRRRPQKILHLSDIHFGTAEAANNQLLLLNHLDRVVRKVGRVAITGDLMETPRARHLDDFRVFAARLASLSGADPIVIPGNHDERTTWGTFERTLEQIVRLDLRAVEVDDEMACVFLGFDSTLDATHAEGTVTEEQRRRVGTRYEELVSRDPGIESYMRIALVHHHPLPFDPTRDGLLSRVKEGISEAILGMVDGAGFVEWCRRRGVGLILHGHKHRPRLREDSVGDPHRRGLVTTVGCGTSLGIRRPSLGYNLINWNRAGSRWSATFYEGLPDGSGFHEIACTVR